MNKTKEAFERPICEALVVRFEGMVCQSPPETFTMWFDETEDRDDYGNEIDF